MLHGKEETKKKQRRNKEETKKERKKERRRTKSKFSGTIFSTVRRSHGRDSEAIFNIRIAKGFNL